MMLSKENREVENVDTDLQNEIISWPELIDKQMQLEELIDEKRIKVHICFLLQETYSKMNDIKDYIWGYVDEIDGYFLDEEGYRFYIIAKDGLVHRFYYTTGRLECSFRKNEQDEWEVIK